MPGPVKALLIVGGSLLAAYVLFPPFKFWVAVNFLPAGTVKAKTGSTLQVI